MAQGVRRRRIGALLAAVACLVVGGVATSTSVASPYDQWANGPPADASFFPIGVWFQDIGKADAYRAIGVNTYVHLDGLWRVGDDKAAGLEYLADRDMKLMAAPWDSGPGDWMDFKADPAIIGWRQQDEPDNAQRQPDGSFGPPVPIDEIHDRYDQIKAADATRPVYLNFGQGVAWDGWVGRGVRTNHPEDYPLYIDGGADIVSFDIYPAASTRPETAGDLWRVAWGVQRLVQWSSADQPVWNFIETTDISASGNKATPTEVRAEVWMSIIHGSRGISYFAHQIGPPFDADALLADATMAAAVGEINARIHDLAAVIRGDDLTHLASLDSLTSPDPFDDADILVDRLGYMVRAMEGGLLLAAVGMRGQSMTAEFDLPGLPAHTTVEVIGESRTIPFADGGFTDTFAGYEAHLYRLILPLPGDADGDGDVDAFDLTAVNQHFGATGQPGIPGDADGDGDVDAFDLTSVNQNFGRTQGLTGDSGASAGSVPEPAAWTVCVVAGLAVLARRRRGS